MTISSSFYESSETVPHWIPASCFRICDTLHLSVYFRAIQSRPALNPYLACPWRKSRDIDSKTCTTGRTSHRKWFRVWLDLLLYSRIPLWCEINTVWTLFKKCYINLNNYYNGLYSCNILPNIRRTWQMSGAAAARVGRIRPAIWRLRSVAPWHLHGEGLSLDWSRSPGGI